MIFNNTQTAVKKIYIYIIKNGIPCSLAIVAW